MTGIEPQEIAIECDLNRRRESILTFMLNDQNGPSWEFECSKATIDESKDNGYDVICNFTERTCPIYEHLLRKAQEMFTPEYQAAGSK